MMLLVWMLIEVAMSLLNVWAMVNATSPVNFMISLFAALCLMFAAGFLFTLSITQRNK